MKSVKNQVGFEPLYIKISYQVYDQVYDKIVDKVIRKYARLINGVFWNKSLRKGNKL